MVCRIQAAWKGYRVRNWYRSYLREHPPTDPVLRAKLYSKVFSSITDQLVDTCNATCLSADELLASVDKNLDECRKVLK